MPQSLKQSVQDALQAYPPLHASRSTIETTVEDGKVILSGYVPSISTKRMADVLASGVDGVKEVVNNLIPGPELERQVARALAADRRTREWPIRVRCDLGYVQLQGQVPDKEVAQAAMEVARQVKGVKHITSSLEVRQVVSMAA